MTNSVGIHALVWVGDWSGDAPKRAMAGARDCGYDRIEIPLLGSWQIDTGRTRALLDECQLAMTANQFLTEATDISSADPAAVAAGEQLLHRAVETVAALGGDYICGTLYSRLGRYDRQPTERGRRSSAEVLRGVADRAADAGIRIGLELCNRYETNLLNTAEQALEMLELIDRPNAVVHLDTFHMNLEETDMVTPVLACGERLGYVHIGESHRGYLGTGTVDFDGFFGALARIGYTGPITFESFSSAVLAPELTGALCIWRDRWQDSADLARHARQFIAQQLTR
ncbi:sugar phosphate isomerase/epimerase family protein [Kitasatospora azatica]|uniref:sugar phosphate isomerase/epimerase family protein n=1 Tax=Kitasatospora azatica TaxID=58347 RepID=UPI0005685270|nr:sugar phosphate isomerase/epimerase [Kitasatospora azatica]